MTIKTRLTKLEQHTIDADVIQIICEWNYPTRADFLSARAENARLYPHDVRINVVRSIELNRPK